MLILHFIFLLSTTLFTKQIFGYVIPACTESSYGRFPYLKSCTKFFECKNGQVTVYSCRPGLAYNPVLADCDLPENVPGCEDIQAQEHTLVVCPRNFIGQVPHPKDCEQYAQCFRGLTHFMICGPGYVYNIETGYCDVRENVPGCQGNFGNGVNFRGDIAISLQTARSAPGRVEPYDGYHPRAPCLTPGCLPINRQPPRLNVTFPSAPVPPLNKPPVPFRKIEIEESTPNSITENLFTSTDDNLVTVSDKSSTNAVNSYPSIDETKIVNDKETSSTINTEFSSDIPQVITNEETTVDYTTTSEAKTEIANDEEKSSTIGTEFSSDNSLAITNEKTTADYTKPTNEAETEDKSKPDHTATILSDLYSGETIDVTITSTYVDKEPVTTTEDVTPSREVETLVNNVTSEVTKSADTIAPAEPETAESSEEGLRVVKLNIPETNKNSYPRVNSRFFELSEKESGRSADSSESWFKNLWSSNSNIIKNDGEIKKKESNGNSSGNELKNSNKQGDVNGKESTTSAFPTKSNLRQPFYVTINGTRYHYIYKDVQIDQNHSKVRSYNHAPLVANVKVSKAPLQINKTSINSGKSNNQLMSWLETEPPFPFSYTPPIYFRSLRNIPKLTPLSGQSLRLRGGSDLNHGYVEVQGSKPGWGVICHTASNWTFQQADIICHQLGYSQGAQMVWKGRYNEDEIYPWVATSYAECQGNETWFQTCKFRNNSDCNIQRDMVGIRCLPNNETYCREDEVFYGGYCYHLTKSNSNLTHEEAAQYCRERSSSLLYITSQKENDFVSEWLIRQHPDIKSVTMGGLGFPASNRSQWIWKDTHKTKFIFSKWWPGWNSERILPPYVKSGVSCMVMKKEFPCNDNQNTKCHTDYFFWDTERCGISQRDSTYICKRSNNDHF
ncbi:uncharacterized protein [Chelonus insularis]|uniref:uncharacterized protein isoform X2 n=1 Tax=Chelonus insularis TaxID=460826 RepID=UPI00158C21DD|nr:uncharacterized protein LOC118065333 isoform X2 [Chelonus insularis]